MKSFRSSTNLFFSGLLWLIVCLALGFTVIFEFIEEAPVPLPITLLSFFIAAILIWILLDTGYRINQNTLRYYSGPIRGKIEISKIQKIEHVKSYFVTAVLKPALGSHGLMVTYNKFDDIYISPKNKDAFLSELLKINPEIKVIN